MKLGIFDFLAWSVVSMQHGSYHSDYIDAELVYQAEDLLAEFKNRFAFSVRRRQLRENW